MLTMSITVSPRIHLMTVLALLSVALLGSPVAAQVLSLRGASGEAFVPTVLNRDASLFKDRLALDQAQQVIFESLMEDYHQAFEDGSRKAKEALEELEPDPEASAEARRRLQEEAKEELKALWEEMRQRKAELPKGTDDEELARFYMERSKEVRAKLDAARDPYAGNERLQETLAAQEALLEEWNAQRHRMYLDFMQNVQLILSEDQAERWPAFERAFRREKTLALGELAGESVNLFQVLRDMDLAESDRQAIADPLAAYDLELDAALRQRNDFLRGVAHSLHLASGYQGTAKVEQLLDQAIDLRIGVRIVNDAFAETIASVLSEDASGEFLTAVRVEGYRRVYGPTIVGRLLRAAGGLRGLSPETRDSIEALHQQYLSELALRNESLVVAVREHEPASYRRRALKMLCPKAEVASSRQEDALAREFRLRDEWSHGYVAIVEAMLSPEQVRELREIRGLLGRPGSLGGPGDDRQDGS